MAEEAPAGAPTKAPAKSPKKKSAPRTKKERPSLPKLIMAESKEQKGVSLAALKRVVARKGVDVTKCNNSSVTNLVNNGRLNQITGAGAAGSFTAKPAKKVVKNKALSKAKKPTTKKSSKKSPAKKALKPVARKNS